MNASTVKFLGKKGWSSERDYDISEKLSYLSGRGWVPFQQAIQFLKSFDGLGDFSKTVLEDPSFPANLFSLESKYGFSWREEAEQVEEFLGINLFPVGCQDIFCIFIGNDNCLYAIDADVTFYKLGENIDESLDNLFSHKFLVGSLTHL